MDHQLVALGVEDDVFEPIAGPIGTDDELARRIVAELDPGDRLSVGMIDVVV